MIRFINFKQLMIGFAIIFVGASMGLVWTSVKTEYRNFLNKGQNTQNVDVAKEEAIDKLVTLSNDVNQEGMTGAAKELLDRLQYTFHFAKTMERVPEVIPFQGGANWLENIEYATTPRFLNPDKPSIDNSVKASKYTGIRYATARQGVSFSLGYFAEFYLDFGKYGMMFWLMVLGSFYALIYSYFLNKASSNAIFNYSIVGAFFFEFYLFEIDGTYLSGRLFASIVTFFILSFFFSKPLLRYLTVTTSEENNKSNENASFGFR
jgi:hypothetical protein